jgi:flagellar motor switch/type III secretory pathway protein FliN
MATALALDGLTDLPRLDPARAALGAALCALIGDAGFDTAVLREAQPAAAWFACADGVRFRFLRCDGRAALLDPARTGDAVALLDRADPELARLEQVLELMLEPEALDEERVGNAVIVSFRDGGAAGLIAVPLDHTRRAGWEERARALDPVAATLPMVVRLLVEGPRLAIAEAGDLAPGDLVLLAPRPGATLEADAGPVLAGQCDLSSGSFTPHPQGGPMAADSSAAPRDFAVPLTLRLPDRMTSAASLAALRPGVALPLGPLTEGMPIELLVAGRPLARGELVQLGDRFAVLIEERAPIDDGIAEPIEIDPEAAEAQA